jgi:hypothetical protein
MEECAQECLHGLIGNGECDDECDSEQCAFDGGECLEDPSTADMLYGIVLEPPETGKSTKVWLDSLSSFLLKDTHHPLSQHHGESLRRSRRARAGTHTHARA